MKKRLFKMLGALLFPALLLTSWVSCTYDYPGKDEITEDQLVSITQRDTKVDFKASYSTYAIVDSIYVIKEDEDGNIFREAQEDKNGIVAQVIANLNGYGYTQFTDSTTQGQPDLILSVSAMEVDYTTIYAGGWWDYYYDWYYWYYWGYGPYYPFYPYPYYPYSVVTTYSAGIAIIDMVDMVNPTAQERAPIVWTAFIRGLLTGNHAPAEVKKAIDECFAQSSYLNIK